MNSNEIKELYPQDTNYPQRLKVLRNQPKLYVIGNIDILNKDSIAIIGSRDCTNYGKDMADKFAKDLTRSGLCIVSGLALGIDAIAHYSCIKNGGKTVAVLGSGFNHIYPKENINLFNLIVETGGTVITEYEPNAIMQKKNFPARNRIISALTLGTLVVEATYRSGTSITARCSARQGKPVFCIPNSIGNKNSSGTINLLINGAKLVKNSENILNELPKLKNKIVPTKKIVDINNEKIKQKTTSLEELTRKLNISENQASILKCILNKKIVTSDEIIQYTGICIQNVNSELTNLEIMGIIKQEAGNKFSIV